MEPEDAQFVVLRDRRYTDGPVLGTLVSAKSYKFLLNKKDHGGFKCFNLAYFSGYLIAVADLTCLLVH